ncbi:MAG: hypothetical protein Q9162_007205 [Coniocarpon cinnabarinum]
MATLGLLGGSSWESTVLYYQHINRMVRTRLGGNHSAPLIIHSVDFHDFERYQRLDQWQEAAQAWGKAAQGVVGAGAQAVMLCCNTFHAVADEIQKLAGVPLIHIVDAVAEKIQEQGLKKVILLGTGSTMNSTYYPVVLNKQGIEVAVPNEEDKQVVNHVIFEELNKGIVKSSSREQYKDIIKRLQHETGAQGVILGCTEIGMLISEGDLSIPMFDTCKIHAEKAVEWAFAHGSSPLPN